MKIFQEIQKTFATAGVIPGLAMQAYSFNERISMGFIILSSGLTSVCVYILNYANTYAEYTQSIFLFSLFDHHRS